RQAPVKREKVILKKLDSIEIDDVQIVGNDKYTRSYVLGKLKIRTPIKLSYPEFNEGINNLAATGNFQSIDYKFATDDIGKNKLMVKVQENNSQMFLRFGVHYHDVSRTAALVNIIRKRLFTNNDIASLD